MNNYLSKTVGNIVTEDYRTAGIFKKYKIDFCCNGNKNFGEVCETKKIDVDSLINELEEVKKSDQKSAVDFQSWPLDLLTDYIEKKHHRYVEQRSPELQMYLDKLCRVHGDKHPELFKIYELFNQSAGELAAHMKKEELILFPAIRKLVKLIYNNEIEKDVKLNSVSAPIQVMMSEHDTEGDRFREIAKLTDNFTPPADGCNTYRVTFSLLKEFEEDLHMHIHLENNILFPGAIEFENKIQEKMQLQV